MSYRVCGSCDKTDGMVYTSNPPKVKCSVTGDFHNAYDTCTLHRSQIISMSDVYSMCKSRHDSQSDPCVGCLLDGRSCKNGRMLNPNEWELVKKPKFSENDIKILENIKVLFPEAEYVERVRETDILGLSNNLDGWICDIDPKLLPGILSGESISIEKEIKEFYKEKYAREDSLNDLSASSCTCINSYNDLSNTCVYEPDRGDTESDCIHLGEGVIG